MDKTWTFTLALMLYSLMCLADCQSGCMYKECSCPEGQIVCIGLNLTTIPPLVNKNTSGYDSLSMDSNEIESIPAGSLPPNMTDMSFLQNPVANIDDTAFDDSVATLKSLYFSNIQFTRIPNAFGHLYSLQYLSISGANIEDWNDDTMKRLGLTLQSLVLDNVGITTWPDWIEYFTSITELTIMNNIIQFIPDNAFLAAASTLTMLNLNNNSLPIIPEALTYLTHLVSLYLVNNKIHDVSFLPQTSTLLTVSLSNNDISDAVMLSKAFRPLATTLNSLDVNNNQLTSIPDFSFFTKVGKLDFTYNKISDAVSGAGPVNLYEIDLANNYLRSAPHVLVTLLTVSEIKLSYNFLQSIQSTDFHSETLFIDGGYNQITELTDTSFPPNSGLMYLHLNNNPITRISSVAMQNLPYLKELNLQSTKLTRLPLALSYLTGLDTLDVSNTPNLVCTCVEKNLTSWFKKLNPDTVLGNCGQTSVYNFFSTFGPFCP